MSEPTFNAPDLVARLAYLEAGDGRDAVALNNANTLALEKVADGLVSLLGGVGVEALARRALRIAQREYPALAGVHVETIKGLTRLIGLNDVLHDSTPDEAIRAGSAPLAHMIDLLIGLLGEDLGLLPVRKMWPDVPTHLHAPISTETDQ